MQQVRLVDKARRSPQVDLAMALKALDQSTRKTSIHSLSRANQPLDTHRKMLLQMR
jgi:hypothetical protein